MSAKGGKKKRPASASETRMPLDGRRTLDSLVNGGIDQRGQRVLVPARRPASARVRGVEVDSGSDDDDDMNEVPVFGAHVAREVVICYWFMFI